MFFLPFQGQNYNPSIMGQNSHVDTYADLPAASLHTGEYWIVDTTTGIPFITQKKAGIYKSDGSIWNYITGTMVDYTSLKVGATTITASPVELAGSSTLTLTPDNINNKITFDTTGVAKLAGGNTFTGDQAFDTNTLIVDSVNHKVGVGASPASDGKLCVSGGNIIIDNSYSYRSRNTGGALVNLIKYTNSNNTEIGANSEITLTGSINLTPPSGGNITIQGGATDSASAVGTVISTRNSFATAGAKLASFRNVSTEKAFIDKDGGAYFAGLVGIGNNAPTYPLDIKASNGYPIALSSTNGLITETTLMQVGSGRAFMGWDGTFQGVKIAVSDSSKPIIFANSPTLGAGEFMRLQNNNLGIGNSPSVRLDITGKTGTDSPVLGSEMLSDSGWTSSGWTGSWSTGFTHTVGNTSPLISSVPISISSNYSLTISVSGRTAGTYRVSDLGGNAPLSSTAGNTTFSSIATTTGVLTIIPTTDFDGKLTISLKPITTACSSFINLRDSAGVTKCEQRQQSGLLSSFYGLNVGSYNLGNYNIGFGSQSLSRNVYGSYLFAFGYSALGLAENAVNCAAFGYASQGSNKNGINNASFGNYSLNGTIAGSNGTAVGYTSLYSATGDDDTAVGSFAGRTLTTGYRCTFIGSNCGYNGSQKVDAVNSTAIGYGSYTNRDNQVVIGNTSVTETQLNGSVGIGQAMSAPTDALDINSNTIRLRTAKTPASATATGNAGTICWDSSYVYVCVATNTWKRSALATW